MSEWPSDGAPSKGFCSKDFALLVVIGFLLVKLLRRKS